MHWPGCSDWFCNSRETGRRSGVIVWSLQISSAYTGICFLWQADIAALEERLHEEEQRAASKVSEAVLSGVLQWNSLSAVSDLNEL